MGFPTGMSPNHIAAQYTPNPGDTTVLNYDDVVKVDFGTEVNGYIIDSAFTIAFNPQFDELLCASKDATMTGLRAAGVDARLGEIGGIIEEVINSYEVTIFNRTYPSTSTLHFMTSRPHSESIRSFHGEGQYPRGEAHPVGVRRHVRSHGRRRYLRAGDVCNDRFGNGESTGNGESLRLE